MKALYAFFVRLLTLIYLLMCWGIGVNTADARPGGGHSSLGHSSSAHRASSRGSSWHSSLSNDSLWHHSSYGEENNTTNETLIFYLFIVVTIIVIVIIIISTAPKTLTSSATLTYKHKKNQQVNIDLEKLFASDTNFSKILFLDFTHLLYSKLHHYAGTPQFSYLTPFISDKLRQQSFVLPSQPAEEVIINGIQWQAIDVNTQQDAISLMIDANYTLSIQGKNNRYAITELWQLCRNTGSLSPEPNQMQTLSCPHCAAPAHFNDAGICPYCKNTLHKGEMHWYLNNRVVTQTTLLNSSNVVSYAGEQGTKLATVKHPSLNAQMESFRQRHRLNQWEAFFIDFQNQIIHPYFITIYRHWSQRNWDGVRHLLSDRLYEAHQFWIDRYKQQQWFNRLDKLKIKHIILAKLEVDRYYEAITVRIFASCYDYTEDTKGKLIGGSKRELRDYSEYWTFVRRIGAERNKIKFNLNQCPQCGAAADQMGQAAKCGYCGSKISTGEFSWVLFLIMQDDAYNG